MHAEEPGTEDRIRKRNSRGAELASSNIPAKSELFLHRQITINFDSGRETYLSVCLGLCLCLYLAHQTHPILSQEKSCAQVGDSAFTILIQTATYVDNSKKDNQHKYKHLKKKIYTKICPQKSRLGQSVKNLEGYLPSQVRTTWKSKKIHGCLYSGIF